MVHTTSSKLPASHTPWPGDIVFAKADASWVHNHHVDALVITNEVANSLFHQLLVDNRSAVNILYSGAYQKIGLRWPDLTPTTFLLYRFTRDSVITKGTIKLAVTLKEQPRAVTMVINFVTTKFPWAFNKVLGRPLIMALKAMTSIHCLIMKFPTTARTCQVRARQIDSRKCYSRSLKLTKRKPEQPKAMEVEKISRGPMETNIGPCLQEDKSTAGPVEELTEI